MDAEIYSIEYADERMEDIKKIEQEIAITKKNKMLFQTLPFHKRRRTAAFDERRLPLQYRRGNRYMRRKKRNSRELLDRMKMHMYFAKRFSMYNSLGVFLPYERMQKSHKYIAAALKTRAIMHDISYHRVFHIAKTAGFLNLQYPESNKPVLSYGISYSSTYSNEIPIEAQIPPAFTSRRISLVSPHEKLIILEKHDKDNAPERMQHISNICIFEVFGKRRDAFLAGYVQCNSIIELNSTENVSYISASTQDKSILLVGHKHVMQLVQRLTVKGLILCGIKELARIGTETNKIVYPYEFPHEFRGADIQRHAREKEYQELCGKPPGKVPTIYPPFFQGHNALRRPLYFYAKKGSFSEGSVVLLVGRNSSVTPPETFEMTGKEKVVGEVIRSLFSYALGHTTGVIHVLNSIDPENLKVHWMYLREKRSRMCYKISYEIITERNTL